MKVFLCRGGSGNVIGSTMNVFEKVINKSKPLLYVPLAMESSRYEIKVINSDKNNCI